MALITKTYHLVLAASIAIKLTTPGLGSASVVYIHLNPLRAGIVKDIDALKRYPFSGHSALMGCVERPWHDTPYVLSIFGRSVSQARKCLLQELAKWSSKGRHPELTRGGLVLSAGGWRALKDSRREGLRIAGDERPPGSSGFMENTLKLAGEA